MKESEGGVVVGILGQWASGKSTAAKTLVAYLGGEDKVVFVNDQHLFAGLVVDRMLELEASRIASSMEADGRRRLAAGHATIWLHPGEDLKTVDLAGLIFRVPDDTEGAWLNSARVELARQIRDRAGTGKPVVVEAGYGPNPPDHTIADLLLRLQEAGVEPKQVKWILVEAGYAKRAERNQARGLAVPVDVFARHAADGGDLDPDHQKRLEEQGTMIQRVANDHDDVERFRADVIAALVRLLSGVSPAGTVDGGLEPA